MIKAVFESDREDRKLSLTVKGHAGQAEVGQDIICASASILAYTLAQIFKTMDAHGDFAETPTLDLESGNTVISCVAKDDDIYAEAMYALFIVQVGYSLLAYNYPQFVELKTFGEA